MRKRPLSMPFASAPRIVVLLSCILAPAAQARAQEDPKDEAAGTGAAITAHEGEAGSPPHAPDPARRAYIAARVLAAIQTHFAHREDVPDLDLDTAFRDYVDAAMGATDRRAFSLATTAFLARMGNGHTWFLDLAMDREVGRPDAFRVGVLDGRWTVTESVHPDLRPGDVIAEIDGQPIERVYERLRPFIPASSERSARHQLLHPRRRWLLPSHLRMGLADGRVVEVDRGGEPRLTAPELEVRRLADGDVAYLRVPSWDRPFEERALVALEELAEARGLVVDVRGNRGGSTPVALIAALMDREWRWWRESTPVRLGIFSLFGEQGRSGFGDLAHPHVAWEASTREGEGRFAGPVAILIDAGCRSACEDFAMPFKDNGRATLVGLPTAGSTGQPYVENLGDDMFFAVGAKRAYFPDGSRFEGVGIAPDVTVVTTPDDVRAGRDPVLERALDMVSAH